MSDNVSAEVLGKIKEDGSFDELRKKLIDALRQNEDLQRFAEEAVLDSKTLNSPAAEKMQRKELFESVRKELEEKVLQEALKIAWKVLDDDSTAIPGAINEKVHEALCAVYLERAVADRHMY